MYSNHIFYKITTWSWYEFRPIAGSENMSAAVAAKGNTA